MASGSTGPALDVHEGIAESATGPLPETSAAGPLPEIPPAGLLVATTPSGSSVRRA